MKEKRKKGICRRRALRFAPAFLLAAALLGSPALVLGEGQAGGYGDLPPSHWAGNAVLFLEQKGVVNGFPDGNFYPLRTVTYGEFLKMAVLAGGVADPGPGGDMHWAENYYDAAVAAGYFTDFQIHRAQLENEIPRGDMALIAAAVLGDMEIEKYDELQRGITDVNAATEHEYDIIKSYAAGVLTGYPDGSFRPEGALSRGEAAAAIHRLLDETARRIPAPEAVKSGRAADIAANLDSFAYPNGEIDQFLAAATTYTIAPDASVFGFAPYYSAKGEEGVKMTRPPIGPMYLLQGGKIVKNLDAMPLTPQELGFGAKENLRGGDYIVCVNTIDNTMLLIPNPYR